MFRAIFAIALIVVVAFIWLTVRYYANKLEESTKKEGPLNKPQEEEKKQ
jgi:uncharacterized protein YdgA (DUF945 family)